MDKFEYKQIIAGRGAGIILSQLDKMKSDGWILESQNGLEYILKRKIQQEDGNKKTFTLTTEEVEIVKDSLWCLINEYEANDKEIYKADNLLDRIKQWQDEAKSN